MDDDDDPNKLSISTEALSIQFLETWVITPMLRWKKGVLEQMWCEQFSSKQEWRPVPTEDGE